ncbi:cytochrome b/b6 domain-containing protein [Desulfoscipio gibsoniae]|uniref:Thiosulfate reductase cytochrome B subunit (Membrane anchoring protein) n=1 Tax=Desulfoscipio gibsoniae DSM 7213 TaxID=767817 RepID=R4KMP2_9FIRM|nr:cytochrome b/b6 domain-containing protein [Desulfoscipio gibsoniae]AGL00901.1 thiosulfate reductase cytochrome B subunit (membrane anchoring protein) [Desulfoscipio gibsoniae DSM 7213]
MIFDNNLLGLRLKGIKTKRHSRTARALHWVLVPSFLLLAASGFYIHKPTGARGFRSMDAARKVHFTAQYFLGFYLLSRVYYAVASRDYRKLFPGAGDIADVPRFAAYELFLKRQQPNYPKYNPGQKLLFSQMAILFITQLVTGAALYSPGKLQMLSRYFGGLHNTRLVHYLVAVILSSAVAGHVYFAFTNSLGKLKSIFTGYFRPK